MQKKEKAQLKKFRKKKNKQKRIRTLSGCWDHTCAHAHREDALHIMGKPCLKKNRRNNLSAEERQVHIFLPFSVFPCRS